jgi:hypothetical protein
VKTALLAITLLLCFFAAAAMSPTEQQADFKARKEARVRELNAQHLPFIRRIVRAYPVTDFGVPVQHEASK